MYADGGSGSEDEPIAWNPCTKEEKKGESED
jgi:hypothetical protein